MRTDAHDLVFKTIAPKYIDITNLSSGGIEKGFLEVLAECLSVERDKMDVIMLNAYVQSAEGAYLDYLCKGVGIVRKKANKTTGIVKFGRYEAVTSAVKIEKDTIIKTKLNSFGKEYRFFVSEEVILPEGQLEISVPVVAEYEGIEYNVISGYICRIVNPINGIDYVINQNNWITTPGTEGEKDDSLRERYYARWLELITGSNKQAYELWAKSISEVSDAYIIPNPRGTGSVDIIISTNSGIPMQTTIDSVQAIIEEKKPLGVDARTFAPLPTVLNITLTLHIKKSYSNQVSIITQKSIEVINAMFVKSITDVPIYKVGEDFVADKLRFHIMKYNPGIKYIDVILPPGIVVADNYHLAVKGTLIINDPIIEIED